MSSHEGSPPPGGERATAPKPKGRSKKRANEEDAAATRPTGAPAKSINLRQLPNTPTSVNTSTEQPTEASWISADSSTASANASSEPPTNKNKGKNWTSPWPSKPMGRPPKKETLEPYKLQIYPSEMREVEEFRQQQNYTSRRLMLLDLVRRARDGEMAAAPTLSTPSKDGASARPLPPVSPILNEMPAVPPAPRIPVYKQAAMMEKRAAEAREAAAAAARVVHMEETDISFDVHLDFEDNQVAYQDPYEFTDADAAYHRIVLDESHGAAVPLAESFNLSDGFGRQLKSPPPAGQQLSTEESRRREIVEKAKEKEPIEYDYSDSTRLLPAGYHREFSKDKRARLHIAEEPVISKDGELVYPPENRTQVIKDMDALGIVTDGRYIVEFHQLLQLLPRKCYVASCGACYDKSPEAIRKGIRRVGAVLEITMTCFGDPLPHTFKWSSSRKMVHYNETKSQPYSTNILLSAAITVVGGLPAQSDSGRQLSSFQSGNSFSRSQLLFKTLNLRTTGYDHFKRVQRFLVSPVVMACWKKEQQMMVQTMHEQQLVGICAADGQYDSPGHCAAYLTYVQMLVELERREAGKDVQREKTAYVLDINVVEKRHTNLNSVVMEMAGFMRSILDLETMNAPITAMVTDQNLSILAFMKKAKDDEAGFKEEARKSLRNFEDITEDTIHKLFMRCRALQHCLDVWHRAKNIGTHLFDERVGKERSKLLLPWIPHIKNHFWYVLMAYRENLELILAKWNGLIYHVQGKCNTATHICDHEVHGRQRPPTVDHLLPEAPKLDEKTETFRVIKAEVQRAELLQNMKYYAGFYHTGAVESFNAVQLRYASKLVFYPYLPFIIRKLLAAMDWNDGVHREAKRSAASGDIRLKKVYSKRCKEFTPRPQKEQKLYSHVPHVMAAILAEACRSPFGLGSHRTYETNVPDDPKKLAPNMARNQTAVEDMMRHHWTRFAPHMWSRNGNDNEEEDEEDDLAMELDEEPETFAVDNDDDDVDDDEDEILYSLA